MSKQVMRSINDSTGKTRQTVQSSQPGWMAHWMRTGSNATAERRDGGAYGNKELDRMSRDDHITLGASGSVKDHGKITSYTESLRMSSKCLGDEGICSAQLKHGQDTDHSLDCGKAINYTGGIQFSSGVLAANEDSLREYRSSMEGTSKKPIEWVKTHFSAKDRSSSTSMPSQERLVGPSTHIVPYHDLERYKLDKGKAVVFPSVSRPSIVSNNQLLGNRLKMIGQEHCQKHFQSTDLIWERKVGSQSEPDTSIDVCFGDHNTSLLLDAPSMDDHHQPKSDQDWFQKTQKSQYITSLPPSQCIASEKNEHKMSRYDPYPRQKLPTCVHEAMRICATVDSVEATPGSCPWFSQTTHSLLITKNSDVDVSKETDIFRRLITQMNGNSSRGLENVPPYFGQANRGVKLQAISSSNSDGQGNVGDIRIGTSKVASKNESSAETDTMDMDFWKDERLNSGANSTRSTKVFNLDNNVSPRIDVASSSRDVGHRWRSSGIPDINLEVPALPAVASSSEDVPTSSRTQSLEMDMLLAQAEQPEPKSNLFLQDSPKLDPTARWVKRLKLSSSDSSAQGTKSSNLVESLSREKKRVFFRSNLKKGIARSETTPEEQHGKEPFLSDGSGYLSKEGGHLSPDPPKKSKEMLLSHVWIKRWLSNGTQISQKKPEAVVVCEPQSLKSSPEDDELQKKQFPSIAAMALMGKSMTGFQSCELQKRGSFTIWNTKAF
ncbi:hypothetical protein C2S53_004352 [Perilla frutescens var. hirtella]|uniref:F-box protein n=1 Tax=Perilla frutescens var. hirtella TaxID=608512 RepID=A0AAD4NXT8_PERFH|nr:hypothetical protein C2S53_004352 [Perilla frutescens var. hirtella]